MNKAIQENEASESTYPLAKADSMIPREVISQILGHSDLMTTNSYPDSFATNIIDEAAKVL